MVYIVHRFMNKIKVTVIPPLLVNGVLETDFQRKANIFNDFFSAQCSIIDNSSILPEFSFLTNNRISDVVFSHEDISKIINDLNPNKSQGHDGISVKMIQLCGDSISHPFSIIFNNALKSGFFPEKWKRGNIVPIHKKLSNQIVCNYRPISLWESASNLMIFKYSSRCSTVVFLTYCRLIYRYLCVLCFRTLFFAISF